MKIALVSDSACDIPYEMIVSQEIHVVPNILIIDGKSIEDNREFSRQEFYEQLPKMTSTPTTSTASVGTYQILYEDLLQEGFDQGLISGIEYRPSRSSASYYFVSQFDGWEPGRIGRLKAHTR